MARTSRNMMIERADEYRVLAQKRRNRGMHTGKRAKGHDWQRPEATTPADKAVTAMLAGWRFDRGEAIEAFRFEMHGEQWEDFV